MRITVFGASGGTGRHVLRQATAAGHDVTAVVRDPARVTLVDDRLTVVRADVMDPSAIAPVIAGADAVVSALGPHGLGRTTVCGDAAVSTIRAMKQENVRRLVVVSASGMHTTGDGPFIRFVVKPIVQRVLRHPFADMRRMEELVFGSGLDWTVVRPPRLTDGPRTGTYRMAVDRNVPRGMTIARADVADCVLRCLDRPDLVRTTVFLAR